MCIAVAALPAQALQCQQWQGSTLTDMREDNWITGSVSSTSEAFGEGFENNASGAGPPESGWLLAAAGDPTEETSVQTEPMLVVEFDPAQPIRQLAQNYLGDADQWPKILESSGVGSILDLQPGQQLRLPVSQVKAANQAIRLSHREIERANQAGAQLFAPQIIALAISNYDEALIKRTLGEWLEAFHLAHQSRTTAGEAYEICQKNRDGTAEARLSDKQGSVEGQRPRESTWRNIQRNALLVEEEKVRTLSGSTAQITFRDASRLRLAPNSQAVIQRLRADPLTRTENTKVSLIEGDFYALLADNSERKRFEVEIPGIEARVDSGDFWISHDADGAKLTNYDVAAVRVAARGETIVLGRNEGALVPADQEPIQKLDVLLAPVPQAPPQDETAIAGQVLLQWTAVAEATGYWLEIASDPQFNRMVTTERGFPQTQFEADSLAPGIYYWRVSALDRYDLPGARSNTRRLEIRSDTVPPYLLVEHPEPGEIIREGPVTIAGQSEPGARLTIDGSAVEIDDQGLFQRMINPTEGEHELTFRVTDRAGNEITRSQNFTYMPDRPAEISYASGMRRIAPGHFIVNSNVLSLAGVTRQHAKLRVEGENGSPLALAYADENGRFRGTVPLSKDHQNLTLRVTLPSGFATTTHFEVTVDRAPPEIFLDSPLPRLTTDAELTVSGNLSEAAVLRLNGREVAHQGRFEQRMELADGSNPIELVATDAAGNVTVRRWTVQLDREPPEITDHQVRIAADENRTALHISITVHDASGLARIAPFTINTGTGHASGYLHYDRVSRRYVGEFDNFGTMTANAKLRQVELMDWSAP